MYLRRDDNGTINYVPEDVPERDWVPTVNVRAVDPPVRRHFVSNMKPRQRANALIQGYVESLVGRHADKESPDPAKSFLRAWRSVEADGNEAGISMAIMQAKGMAVQFYFQIHGIGPVVWLPVLVTASNDHTRHIMRETGPDRVSICKDSKPKPDPDSVQRRSIPPKVETVLFKGRRT